MGACLCRGRHGAAASLGAAADGRPGGCRRGGGGPAWGSGGSGGGLARHGDTTADGAADDASLSAGGAVDDVFSCQISDGLEFACRQEPKHQSVV